eukprot:TRINITY_DN7608_c0_g1_i4.p1 TRINITY_DN7608_c0_g1~~TRINITY_DN7608_c0_g1_i4.p1  ORF type:complete len:182 (-),score=78.47 TRINITY_DN7608_c0_g1_i4:121-666(-)
MPKEIELYKKEQIEDLICTAYGGRAAEELYLGSITTGAQDDLQKATKLSKSYVGSFGMSKDFGVLANIDYSNPYVGERKSLYSSETADKFDSLVEDMCKSQYEKAKKILTDKAIEITKLADLLLKKEMVELDELTELLGKSENQQKESVERYREDMRQRKVQSKEGGKQNEGSNESTKIDQ